MRAPGGNGVVRVVVMVGAFSCVIGWWVRAGGSEPCVAGVVAAHPLRELRDEGAGYPRVLRDARRPGGWRLRGSWVVRTLAVGCLREPSPCGAGVTVPSLRQRFRELPRDVCYGRPRGRAVGEHGGNRPEQQVGNAAQVGWL